jgi:hypothetical protein
MPLPKRNEPVFREKSANLMSLSQEEGLQEMKATADNKREEAIKEEGNS